MTVAAMSILWLLLIGATKTCGFLYLPPTHQLRGRSLAFSGGSPLMKPVKTSVPPHFFRVTPSHPPKIRRRTTCLGLANGEEIGNFYMLLAEGGIVAAFAGAASMLISILAYSLLAIAQRPLELGRNSKQLDDSKQDFLKQQTQAKNLSLLALGLAVSGFLLTTPIIDNVVKTRIIVESKPTTTLLSERTYSSIKASSIQSPSVATVTGPRSQSSPQDKPPSSISSFPSQKSGSLQETPVDPKSSAPLDRPEGTPRLDTAAATPSMKSAPLAEAPPSDSSGLPAPEPLRDVSKEEQPAVSSPLPSPSLDKSEDILPKGQPSELSSDSPKRSSETSSASPADIAKTSTVDQDAQRSDDSSTIPPSSIASLSSQSGKLLMESPPVIKPLEQSSLPPSRSSESLGGAPIMIESSKPISPLSRSSGDYKRPSPQEQQSDLPKYPTDTSSARPTESVMILPMKRNSRLQDNNLMELPSAQSSEDSKDAPTAIQPSKAPASSALSAPVPTLPIGSTSEEEQVPSTPSPMNVLPIFSKLFGGGLGKREPSLLLGTCIVIGSVLLLQGFLQEKEKITENSCDREKSPDTKTGDDAVKNTRNVAIIKGTGRSFTGSKDTSVDTSVGNDVQQTQQTLNIGIQTEKQPLADTSLDVQAANSNITIQADVEILRDSAGVPFFYGLYPAPFGKEINLSQTKDLVADDTNGTIEVDENVQNSLDYWWEEGISGKNLTQVVLGTKSPVLDSFSFPMAMPREIRRQLVLAKYGVNNTKSSVRLPVTVRNLTRRRRLAENKAKQEKPLSEPVRNVADSWLENPEPTFAPPPPKEISSLRLGDIKKLTKTIDSAIEHDRQYSLKKANNSTDLLLQSEAAEADRAYKRALQALNSRNESERSKLKP